MVAAALGFTVPCSTALVFVRLDAAPVTTVGEEAASAAPGIKAAAAPTVTSTFSIRFIHCLPQKS